jgi:hypothetical protein
MSKRDDQVLAAVAGKRMSSRGFMRGNCPWCVLTQGKEDRKGALSLHAPTGRWHCFRCGSAGKIQNMPADITSLAPDDVDAPEVEIELPPGFIQLASKIARESLALRPAFDYLQDVRGVDPKVIKLAKVGACATGQFGGRVVVPMFDRHDEYKLVGWVARDWYDGGPLPYVYASGMKRGAILYNARALDVETDEPCLVVEGTFDTFPFWPHAVAVLGKLSGDQMSILLTAKRPLAVVMDGDAWREGEALALHLKLEGMRAGSVKLPPRVDPDEMVEEVMKEARECVL